jgi:hypothetical protein
MLERLSTRLMPLLLFVVLMTAGAGASFAQTCGTTTWNLTAGQTIDVGSVTVGNDAENLYVTYKLDYPGAYFGTLHLWAGNDIANVPANPQGTPVPGQFPFKYTPPDNTTTEYTFTIPFKDLLIQDVTKVCGLKLHVVTHAEVNNVNGKNETAFGGDKPGTGPRWWFHGEYSICCPSDSPDIGACETAFAKGGWVFTTDAKSNPERLPSLRLTKNRWGWAINLGSPGTTTYDIWAGAGLNNTANGTKVGTLTVEWDGSLAEVTYTLSGGFVMEELHIYAGDAKPTTTAPGQYGYTRYFDPPVATHTAELQLEQAVGDIDGVWLIAHAVTCAVEP